MQVKGFDFSSISLLIQSSSNIQWLLRKDIAFPLSSLEEFSAASRVHPPTLKYSVLILQSFCYCLGVVYPSSLTTIPAGGNQNTDGEVGNSAGNLFTSALWSFVESIPTTPASASDNALVNRALVRMSSFSRLRMNALSTNACNGCAVTGKAGKIKGGFIMVSVIVALIAILWVLILGPMKILGRCFSSWVTKNSN